ncbi:glycerophosphodiester phosphodiesterase family protein [Daeguia caeni]|uniref:Glycerophosphodiester phosphodiesterase family protein n=1 Tax=Daeguia caeni TaxID=439612 RepID=A0ABV9H6E9_9HYPH
MISRNSIIGLITLVAVGAVLAVDYRQSHKIRTLINRHDLETMQRLDEMQSANLKILADMEEEQAQRLAKLDDALAAIPETIHKAIQDTTRSTFKLWSFKQPAANLSPSQRIAHAGGIYNGRTYTNSLEALEKNKEHFSLFEMDLVFTADGHLVCAHDWDNYARILWGLELDTVPTLEQFRQIVANNKAFTNCTLDQLVDWLHKNPQARIITDTKEINSAALDHIAHNYPDDKNRFIPQIYNMDYYDQVRALGFEDVILTVYQWGGADDAIVEAARGKKLFAVTVPDFRAPYLAMKFRQSGHKVYAHTVNTAETLHLLRYFGVDEVYTDSLIPGKQ